MVSIPVRRKKGWPEHCLLISFGLGRQVADPRIAVAAEPYPGRWTHHVVLSRPEELDETLLAWLRGGLGLLRGPSRAGACPRRRPCGRRPLLRAAETPAQSKIMVEK